MKLSGKAFRTLKRRRRMAALATAKVSGPIGKSRTVKKKVSIKAPSKPKRKRSGDGGGGGVRTPRCWAQPQLLPDGTYHPNPCAFVAGRP